MAQSQYAESSDLVALSIPLATASRFGTTAITAQLQAASSIVDSYIQSIFTLPLLTWDQGLRLRVCNIAAYYLYWQYGIADTDHLIANRYQEAIKWLEEIKDQEINPTWTDSSGASPVQNAAGPYIDSDIPVGFTDRGIEREGIIINNSWWWW